MASPLASRISLLAVASVSRREKITSVDAKTHQPAFMPTSAQGVFESYEDNLGLTITQVAQPYYHHIPHCPFAQVGKTAPRRSPSLIFSQSCAGSTSPVVLPDHRCKVAQRPQCFPGDDLSGTRVCPVSLARSAKQTKKTR
jgi:hypothetical protein